MDPMQNLNNAADALNQVAQRAGGFWDDADQRIAAKETLVDNFVQGARDELTSMHEWEVEVGGDADKFYPVRMRQDAARFNYWEFVRYYSMPPVPDGLAGLHSRFVSNGGTWGGNPCLLWPQYHSWTYQETLGQMSQSNGRYHVWAWLKGGGYKYRVRSSYVAANPTVFLERTNGSDNPANPVRDWFVEPILAPNGMPINNYGVADQFPGVPSA